MTPEVVGAVVVKVKETPVFKLPFPFTSSEQVTSVPDWLHDSVLIVFVTFAAEISVTPGGN